MSTGADDDGGMVDELADELSVLGADDDHDVERALAIAHAEHGATPAATVVAVVAGRPVALPAGTTSVIGRRGDLVVDAPQVSRRHLVVAAGNDGSLTCQDAGSSNGAWLRRGATRRPIGAAPVALAAGDVVVTLGEVELLRVATADGTAR